MAVTGDFIYSVILAINIITIKSVIPQPIISNIRYCDGDNLVSLTSDQCSGGINFGDKKPDCVCITGIYRFWMDTCLLHEGYSYSGCSTLFSYDDKTESQASVVLSPFEKDSVSQVIGLQFALGSSNDIENYQTETLAIFSENDTDYEPLKVIRTDQTSLTSTSKVFFTNAEAFLIGNKDLIDKGKMNPFICIGKSNKGMSSSRMCLLERSKISGGADWLPHFNPLKIEVKNSSCSDYYNKNNFSDWYALKLIPDWCFDLITKEKSECALSCSPTEGVNSTGVTTTPSSDIDYTTEDDGMISGSSTITNPVTGGPNPKPTPDGDGDGDGEDGGSKRTMRPPNGKPPAPYENSLKDCKEPTIGEIKNQHNSFLNRKLNHWSKLRQVGQLDKPMLNQIKPTRTFRILDIVKQIAQKTCPNKFVSPIFFDQAVDLFVILHKGREYRYTEDLEEKDALWIEKILHNCNMGIPRPIPLYSEDSDSGCNDFEKAEGYCASGTMETNDCEQVPLNITQDHSEFKHHFVVDAAWNLIDLVQIVCFDKFAESYRMFHAWEQSSEKLFTREIRKLWVQPKLDKKVYQNLLTPTAVFDMYNMEMCIEAAYNINPILTRLLRPPEPKRFFRRKKRSADDADRIGTTYDIFCRKSSDEFYTPC